MDTVSRQSFGDIQETQFSGNKMEANVHLKNAFQAELETEGSRLATIFGLPPTPRLIRVYKYPFQVLIFLCVHPAPRKLIVGIPKCLSQSESHPSLHVSLSSSDFAFQTPTGPPCEVVPAV